MQKHPVLVAEVRKLTAAIKAKDIQIPGKVDELKLPVAKQSRECFLCARVLGELNRQQKRFSLNLKLMLFFVR